LIDKGLWEALACNKQRVVRVDEQASLVKQHSCRQGNLMAPWLVLQVALWLFLQLVMGLRRSERIIRVSSSMERCSWRCRAVVCRLLLQLLVHETQGNDFVSDFDVVIVAGTVVFANLQHTCVLVEVEDLGQALHTCSETQGRWEEPAEHAVVCLQNM
jgi:hypothetical protein